MRYETDILRFNFVCLIKWQHQLQRLYLWVNICAGIRFVAMFCVVSVFQPNKEDKE